MAPKLEYSKVLGRMTRTEGIEEQGILTWDLIKKAILEHKGDEAIEWLRYIKDAENFVKPAGPGAAGGIQRQLAWIAEKHGEEHVEKDLRWWRRKLIDAGDEPTYRLTPEERLQHAAETFRADYSGSDKAYPEFTVTEEPDRYVMELDPCGSCGKLRRAEAAGGHKVAKTSKAYPWSWGKKNVPYYCAHECIWWEIMSIEDIGYPVRITEFSEDPSKPCLVYFYKDPKKIPEKYFTRVGKKRDIKKFK